MARKKYEQICLRFALDNTRDRRLFKIIDDLDLEVHKSKNRFIMNAIEAYVDGCGEELLTKKEKRENYLTKEEFEERIEVMRNQIRIEVYQELIVFLAKSGVSAALMNANITQEMNDGIKEVEEVPVKENSRNSIPAEMLADIEKWS